MPFGAMSVYPDWGLGGKIHLLSNELLALVVLLVRQAYNSIDSAGLRLCLDTKLVDIIRKISAHAEITGTMLNYCSSDAPVDRELPL